MNARYFILTAGAVVALAAPAAQAAQSSHQLACGTKSKATSSNRSASTTLSNALRRPLSAAPGDVASGWGSSRFAPSFQYSARAICTRGNASKLKATTTQTHQVKKIDPAAIASAPAISGGGIGVSVGIPLGENTPYWDGDSYVESSLVEYPPAEPQAAAVVNDVQPAVAADQSANAGAAAALELTVGEVVFDT